MIQTNQAYNSIIQQGDFTVEYKFEINGDMQNPYLEDSVVEGVITERLFDVFGIGNLFTKTLNFVFMPDVVIPRKAKINVKFRVVNQSAASDWYPKGTYYVSTRTALADGSFRVMAYDASLKTNIPLIPSGTWTETTTYALYSEICTKIGVSENSATATYLQTNNVTITTAPDIGQNGTTMKEILSYIGVLYGKNWIVNEYEELAMIFAPVSYPAYDVADVNVSPTVTVDRLRIWKNGSTYIQYPDVTEAVWDEMTGYIVEALSPYVTEDNIADIATELIGTTYTGFDAAEVVEDPAIQLGDGLSIDGANLVLISRVINMGESETECSAPYEEETENEYPTQDPISREVSRSEVRTEARIEAVDDRITATVVQVNEDLTVIQTQVTQNAEGIESVTQRVDNSESYLRWDGSTATLSIGESTSPTEAQVSPSGFAVVQDGEEILSAKGHTVTASHLATESVEIGRYEWSDEGANGFTLFYIGG